MTHPIRVLVTNAGEGPGINFCRFWNAEADEMHPLLAGTDPRFIENLFALATKTKADLVYASDTNEELLKLSEHRDVFLDAGIRVLMPDHAKIEVFEDKWRTISASRPQGSALLRRSL
jgi:hypothetical protein